MLHFTTNSHVRPPLTAQWLNIIIAVTSLTMLVLVGIPRGARADGFVATADRCRSITAPKARLRCFDEALRSTGSPRSKNSRSIGPWRLVRSPHPQGGPAAISIMRTADISLSDPDFAGMTVRCHDTAIEVLLVLITPFPLRARPKVTIEGTDNMVLDGIVVPPGSAILLPDEATALATGSWRQRSTLTIAIRHGNVQIRGIVPLEGLADALQTLHAECQ